MAVAHGSKWKYNSGAIFKTMNHKTEWMQHFENEKAKAKAIQTVIDTTDKEIDQMIYQLYGLTEDEIKIVKGTN